MPIAPKVDVPLGLGPELNIATDDITGPVSYTTGGVSYSAAKFQLQKIKFIAFMIFSASGNFQIRPVSPKAGAIPIAIVLRFFTAAGAEVAPGTNLSAETFRYNAFGV